jgi:hypothetical protein
LPGEKSRVKFLAGDLSFWSSGVEFLAADLSWK